MEKMIITNDLRKAHLNGLGEIPILFYGVAKQHGVRTGDTVTIRTQVGTVVFNDTFKVGSYINQDKYGRKVSGFALLN